MIYDDFPIKTYQNRSKPPCGSGISQPGLIAGEFFKGCSVILMAFDGI
jgi:hypothetical protein